MKNFNKKNHGLLSNVDLKKTSSKVLYWVFFAIMIIAGFICLFPCVWIILSSFKDIKEFMSIPPTIIPRTFHLEKLAQTWQSMNFYKYYLNSFYMAGGNLAFCIIINGLAGYVLSRLKPAGSAIIFTIILWIMMMPNTTSMVPLFRTFIKFPLIGVNLSNTYLPMWLMAGASPFYILIFKGFFDGIPSSYIEAATLDGYSNLGIFTRIILPLSKPVIMVISIFSINASWGDFLWPYIIIKDQNLLPITVKIFAMKAGGFPIDVYLIALVFSILPPAVLFMIFQKYILSGFTLSGVKG